ncbi:hypothetical protein SASC256_04050 [Staphylococcus argenteus]|nr:hypothetical protein SA19061_03400 [Staphylococcus argenteus]GJF54636.1 hypothetical protein SA19088_13790 [Staphylococcus argenteus]GJF60644.1 hypothetical protein SA19105_21320 [Staphylococcus argenteus]GJF73652.1 hypothetical protein SA19202_22600 [Staphylococcus argenteus]GJF86359.1 hypothetical protein SA20015_20680 [Staphylococcus argenteus]
MTKTIYVEDRIYILLIIKLYKNIKKNLGGINSRFFFMLTTILFYFLTFADVAYSKVNDCDNDNNIHNT